MERQLVGRPSVAATAVTPSRTISPAFNDDAYLSAEERAQLIESELKMLAPIGAVITAHLYKTDRAEFNRQAQVIDETVGRIRAMVVGLRMAAESEYAPVPWHVRLFFWLFSFIGAVQRVRQPWVKARRRYDARLRAASEYEDLGEKHIRSIRDIRYERVDLRHEQLLRECRPYQELLAELPDLNRQISDYGDYEYSRQLRNERSAIKERMKQISDQLWQVALQEFGEEDF